MKKPSRRVVTLTKLRVAGHHNDSAMFTRTLVEERVSYDVAKLHFLQGQHQRAAGVRCDCHECKAARVEDDKRRARVNDDIIKHQHDGRFSYNEDGTPKKGKTS